MSGPNLPHSAGLDPHQYAPDWAPALYLDDSPGAQR